MSGIYGIFRFDGGPAPAEWLERMRSAMEFYGPEGGGQRIEGAVGLGFLLRELNPEDGFEAQPVMGARGPVVTAARLDNREELLAELGVAASEGASTPDGKLVSLAFDRWGERVCERLEGDWSLGAWDARERRLLLARDAMGNAPFYYYRGEGFIAFASSLKALLALPVKREPDLLRMAEVLVAWQHDAELTAYAGFRRLVWAHALAVDAQGQSRQWRYWAPEELEPLRLSRDEEYVEGFLELYTRAVRSCLRTRQPLAATLSGGRDSGSVVALTAPLLAAQGRRVTAYTSVPLLAPDGAGRGKLGDEWGLAHATAEMAGDNVRHVPVDAAGYGVVAGIEYLLAVHDGPGHAAANQFWLQAIAETVQTAGERVVLTGAVGNATVSWRGNGGALLALRQGRMDSALRLLLGSEANPWLALKRQVGSPLLTPVRRWQRRRGTAGESPWRSYSALRPELAAELRLEERMRQAGHDGTFTPSPLEDRQLPFFGPHFGIGACLLTEMGMLHGLTYLDPTANRALADFVLRTPDEQFRRSGQSSWLFQRALQGRLPEAVLQGRQKGLQAADIGHRLLLELGPLEACLEAMEASSLACGVLDLERMRACVEELKTAVTPQATGRAQQILARGLGVGLFLLKAQG